MQVHCEERWVRERKPSRTANFSSTNRPRTPFEYHLTNSIKDFLTTEATTRGVRLASPIPLEIEKHKVLYTHTRTGRDVFLVPFPIYFRNTENVNGKEKTEFKNEGK